MADKHSTYKESLKKEKLVRIDRWFYESDAKEIRAKAVNKTKLKGEKDGQ